MLDSFSKIIYFILFLSITFVRKIHTSKYRKLKIVIDYKSIIDIIFLGLNGIAMLLPIIYMFSDYLNFADYTQPSWSTLIGIIIFLVAILMLWRSHKDLGNNWTITVGLRDNHKLITSGIFKYIRHPMYAAHIYWAIATVMMLPNWLATVPFVITTISQYLLRYKTEEEMMTNKFGDQYKSYMETTGRILPNLKVLRFIIC